MGMVFGLALRQTEGLIGSVIRPLGLDLAVPDHSTLSRRAKTLDVPPLRRAGTGPLHLLVDSTGLKLGGAGEWLVEKHGTSRRRSWRKLHTGIDAASGEIVAVEVSKKEIDDGAVVDALLDQIADPIGSLTRLRSRPGLPGGHRTSSRRCRHRAAARNCGPECIGRDRPDTARPSPADHHRARSNGVAKSQRLQRSGQGRGIDRPIQARDRRCASIAHRPDRGDRSCHCCCDHEPDAGARTPELCAYRLNNGLDLGELRPRTVRTRLRATQSRPWQSRRSRL
jgi:hypothetical protein